jgi:hypothetical protein
MPLSTWYTFHHPYKTYKTNFQEYNNTQRFPSSLRVQTVSGAHPASCPKDTGGPIPRGKARPGRDADHSIPPSAKIMNE